MNRLTNTIMNTLAAGGELPPENRAEALCAAQQLLEHLNVPDAAEALASDLKTELGESRYAEVVGDLRRAVGLQPRALP